MKRIAFWIGLTLISGSIFAYSQTNSDEAKNTTEVTSWVNEYKNAWRKGGKLLSEALENIRKHPENNIMLEGLLAIAKDKTMTSERGLIFRCTTIKLIGELKNEKVFDLLKNIAEDKEQLDVIKASAIQRMAYTYTSKDRKVFDYLISKLNNPVPVIRQNAVLGLLALRNPEAGPYLMPLLEDNHEGIELLTIGALGAIRYKEAVDELIQKLATIWEKEEDPIKEFMKEGVLLTTVNALGQIGDNKAIEPLITVLLDKNLDRKGSSSIRSTAAKALGNFKNKQVIDALIMVVEEHNYNSTNGIAAAEALGEIGDACAATTIKKAIELQTDSYAIKKYKDVYKKITGKDYEE